MNPNAPQGVVRTLITEVDHLSRVAYAMHDEELSTRYAALRTELSSLERRFGASPPRPTTAREIARRRAGRQTRRGGPRTQGSAGRRRSGPRGAPERRVGRGISSDPHRAR